MGDPLYLGEISGESLTGNDTSVEYLLDATNDTSSNDSLPQQGFFKKVGGGIKSIKTKIGNFKNKIGNVKNKIGSFKDNSGSGKSIGGGHYIGRIRTNSGSGVKDPENAKWALLGIGLILLVTFGGLTWYKCQKKKKQRDTKCEVQQVNKM
ncbi:hypothetical protein AVEN_134130-1 [Araneus ventricosus]|uniref:Uncharacterized protein n=1 Tax=Araneus ventricosus TaxID=182803 RepID=A0A4Y2SRU3_ARAVE|nr:hypothetical protein AVEN_134130-1 [Araneus ventricosus]